MKRTITITLMALLLCVCMVFGLTACGGFTQDDIDNAVNEATAPLNSQITALEADIADKAAKITTLETEKAALTTEKTELLEDIEEIEAEVTALETEKATLEAEVAALENEKASLTKDKATLEASITAKNNEIATLNSSIDALNTEKASLTARVGELEASITAKDTEISSLNSSIATLTAEKQALTDKVAKLEKENAELKECLAGNHAFEVSYEWADDYSDCTATQVCQRTHCDLENELTATSITVSGTTLTANFDGVDSTTVDITAIEDQNYIVALGENNNLTYVIYNKAGLDAWKTAANSDVSTNLTLACDIEYNANWSMLDITYSGTIDGNGYAIVGLNCSTTENASFIFGNRGVIKHLGMVDGSFSNSKASLGYGSRAFLKVNNGVIMGCYNTSSCTSAGGREDYGNAAGISNSNYGKIIACYNAGTISAGGDCASGICCYNEGVISSCYNTGAVSGKGESYGYDATAITSANVKIINDCYYTQPSRGYENQSSGTATNITNVAGSDWTAAMNAMNAAIEAYNADEANTVKCNYRYAINTDAATKDAQPLVIVEVEAN